MSLVFSLRIADVPWTRLPVLLKNIFYWPYKQSVFSNITGPVLELGPGLGVNFNHYPTGTHVTAIEPDKKLHPWLHWRAKQRGLNLVLLSQPSSMHDLPNHGFATVVGTLVLCAVPNPADTLQHIVRVLKPNGTFIFLEHILAPHNTRLHQWQKYCDSWFQSYAKCSCARATDRLIQDVFPAALLRYFKLPFSFPLTNSYVVGRVNKQK